MLDKVEIENMIEEYTKKLEDYIKDYIDIYHHRRNLRESVKYVEFSSKIDVLYRVLEK